MVVALVVLFVGLVVGTIGNDLLRRYAPDALSTRWVSLSIGAAVSGLALLLFLVSSYYRLTNARMRKRDALPGALLATVAIVLTLQALPLFVDLTSGIVALQALGTTFLLLLWLYVMANVIVFGSVLNWQLAHGRRNTTALPRHDTPAAVDPTLEDTADDVWPAPADAPPVVREPTELR
jgi:membrane protein